MSTRGFNKIYSNAVEIPVNLGKRQNHGVGIDSIHTIPDTEIIKIPRSHQILRVTQDEELKNGTIHYSVRHHALQAPSNRDVQNLLDALHSPQIKQQSGKIVVNTLFPQIMNDMNPCTFKGFYLGQWDSSITHYIHYDDRMLIDSQDLDFTSSMMTELITPRDAISRIKHDPYDQKLNVWCDVMAKQARKRSVHAEESTAITTGLVNRHAFIQALKNDTPGIYRYTPTDKNVPTDRMGYSYKSMNSFIDDEAMETGILSSTKCDSFVGAINIASLANLKENGPGVFSDSSVCRKEDPIIFKENNKDLDDFLNAAALFMTIGYHKSIMIGIRKKKNGGLKNY